ncbi:MAG: hypothetical protein CM1200mP18_16380 [Gammaproteobacteria bacterium]|nr:MAG: hypothetical protein CM1200mP18_16380 [Gammaproteobacteria bacterium]
MLIRCFNLDFPPRGLFIPRRSDPPLTLLSKKDLGTHGYEWHKKNSKGTGPFKFLSTFPPQHVAGEKYAGYHFEGRPYLDGFKANSAPKMARSFKKPYELIRHP